MATTRGGENHRLSDRLFREPHAFDFFQAVRLLERLARERARTNPRRQSFLVGQDQPDQEAARFRSQPSLSFPPSPIVQVRALDAEANSEANARPVAEMLVSFMGVTGPAGVLPYHYTALLLRRIRDKDFSLRDFLDLFHHRAIALFYRAGVKYRLPFVYERSKLDASIGEDRITWALFCLAGMGTGGLRRRLEVDDEVFLYYSGHFAHFPRSAVVLESLLADYFAVPIKVLQLQGQWLKLDAGDQAMMPCPACPKGMHTQLGVDLVAGDRVWDIQSKLRLQLGPLTYAQFQRFLPNGDAVRPLCQLTRLFVGPELDFDVQLVLRPEEVPITQVGVKDAHLGWNTWIRTRPFTEAADDAVFFLDEV
jgi:type VI secretion system protein ImpH